MEKSGWKIPRGKFPPKEKTEKGTKSSCGFPTAGKIEGIKGGARPGVKRTYSQCKFFFKVGGLNFEFKLMRNVAV